LLQRFSADRPRVSHQRELEVAMMTLSLAGWGRGDPALTRIAWSERQWNRQQVQFEVGSAHVEVTGGDGFETSRIVSAELAKNCPNAGLWEVHLYVKEGDAKALYYHGWFTFPLGHYRGIFEANTGVSYLRHWCYLEHWASPEGQPVSLDKCARSGRRTRRRWRSIPMSRSSPPASKTQAQAGHGRSAPRMEGFSRRTLDFVRGVRTAGQVQPGSPAAAEPLQELELSFGPSSQPPRVRMIVSGFRWDDLPRLAASDHPQGFYMPMGISVPPFNQRYDALLRNPPERSPYFSGLLDADQRWIEHNGFGIAGVVMHRDLNDPGLVHVYPLSYERETLVAHFIVRVNR
jgi:hypothetical protein